MNDRKEILKLIADFLKCYDTTNCAIALAKIHKVTQDEINDIIVIDKWLLGNSIGCSLANFFKRLNFNFDNKIIEIINYYIEVRISTEEEFYYEEKRYKAPYNHSREVILYRKIPDNCMYIHYILELFSVLKEKDELLIQAINNRLFCTTHIFDIAHKTNYKIPGNFIIKRINDFLDMQENEDSLFVAENIKRFIDYMEKHNYTSCLCDEFLDEYIERVEEKDIIFFNKLNLSDSKIKKLDEYMIYNDYTFKTITNNIAVEKKNIFSNSKDSPYWTIHNLDLILNNLSNNELIELFNIYFDRSNDDFNGFILIVSEIAIKLKNKKLIKKVEGEILKIKN